MNLIKSKFMQKYSMCNTVHISLLKLLVLSNLLKSNKKHDLDLTVMWLSNEMV